MDNTKRPVILIIDDQPEMISVMSMYFNHYGYRFFTAKSAKVAYSIIENEEIDLVICDLVMPGTDGMEFFKRVRQIYPVYPHFVFCNGLCEIPFSKPYPDGVLGFVQKPFSMMEMMEAVESHFKKTEMI